MPGSRSRATRTDGLLLLVWNFCAIAALLTTRTVRDVLFLANESTDNLPLLYIVSPLVVTAIGVAYGAIAHRAGRALVPVTTAIIAAGLLAARLAIGPSWLYYVLYVGVDVLGAIVIMQLWTVAGDRFSPRDARRWFGIVGAGGTIANIVIGLLLSTLVAHTGAENLLYGAMGFLLVIIFLSVTLARRAAAKLASVPRRRTPPVSDDAPGTSHLSVLGPMIVLMVIAGTLLDFQFKAIATEAYEGDRVGMVRFFGILSSATGAVSLIVQLFLSRRVIDKVGVTGALLFLPTTLGVAAVGLMIAPSLVTATIAEFGDATFRYTLNDSGMQLVFLPVPTAVRARKKALFEAVLKPGAEAFAGAGLWAYRSQSDAVAPVAIAAIITVAAWLLTVIRLRSAYARSLTETLRRRRIVPPRPGESLGKDAEQVVRAALQSHDARELAHGLDLARLAPASVADAILPLCDHPDEAVRAQALDVIAAGGLTLDDSVLAANLDDPEPAVRATAIRAARPTQLAAIAPLLDDAEPEIAAAAAAALHRHGDPAARNRALARAEALLDGGARERHVGLRLARELADPALLARVTRALDDPRDARHASDALAAIGAPAEPVLVAHVQVELERAFTAIACAEGLGHRESTLQDDGTRRPVPFAPDRLDGPAALISRTLRERHERARDRMFWALGALQPDLDVPTVRANLAEPDPVRRANAVEALDAVRWGARVKRFKPLVIALIDDSPRARKAELAARHLALPRRDRDEWLDALLDDADTWMVACAAYYAGAAMAVTLRGKLERLARDPRPLVADTVREALLRLDHPDREALMLTTTEKVLFLKGAELFAAIPTPDLAGIAEHVAEDTFDAGDAIFTAGDHGDALYLVVEGKVRIGDADRAIAELGEREVFGEMALLDPAPRSATATALTAVVALRLDRDDFVDVLAERPEVAAGVLKVLTRRLRAATVSSSGGS